MNNWLKIYHFSPYPLRVVAASLRGYYLRSWRYGPETERLVAEALERETWSQERWQGWQQERLAFMLHRAATQVPYYREQWLLRRRKGDRVSWEYLENWPILEKETLRQNPSVFVADDCNVRRMFHEHTSGTTGNPLSLWWSKETVRAWYALFEARCRRWHGVSRNDRWAILGGQLVAPVSQRRPPFWVWNVSLKQLYMSSYHLAPDLIPHYLDALQRYCITYLWGYTSALYALAYEALRLGRSFKMAVVITNAEPVFDYQRRIIQQAFQCQLKETYGMAEIAMAASECSAGKLHLWPEVGWLEIIESDRPVSAGIAGDFVCTGLLNKDMPLIRYKVGDCGNRPDKDSVCGCGRTLPILAAIEGRSDDLLYTSDGRRIGRLDPVFKADLPIKEAQIIQETLNRIRVKFVPSQNYTSEAGRSIIERLRERIGPIEVSMEEVAEIPRTANGKFRAVICKLDPNSKKLIDFESRYE